MRRRVKYMDFWGMMESDHKNCFVPEEKKSSGMLFG